MTIRLQGWLEEQVRAAEAVCASASTPEFGALKAERRVALREVLQHLEDLGPLLSLGEVREKLLGDGEAAWAAAKRRHEAQRKLGGAEHYWAELGITHRAALARVSQSDLEAALDTFDPPVEGGGMANISESPGVEENRAITEQVGGGVGAGEGTESGVDRPVALTARVDSATASTEGENCERGEGQSPREGRGGSHAGGAVPLHPSEPESDSSVSSVESTFSRDGGTRHRDPIRRCQPGPGGLLDSTSNANAPLASPVAGGESGDVLAPVLSRDERVRLRDIAERFAEEAESAPNDWLESDARQDAALLLRLADCTQSSSEGEGNRG